MKTLLNVADSEEMLRRIHQLRPDSPPAWGKMSAAQMLAHCVRPLRVALGEVKLRRSWIGVLFGGLAKKKLVGEAPFQRDLPTDKTFKVSDPRDFAIEQANLIAALQRFRLGGEPGITKEKHPFFGPMTSAEWQTLMWKHLDHHLRQFQV